mmetsp:Transcript_24200/g.52417  ORF Transcript_24200/g.52417 Transcript_24200/m.52417 type:complete len:642 (-) Transcript_24200:30-1955(-)
MLRRLTYEAVTRGSSGGGITTRHGRPRLRVFQPTSGISMRHYAACCSFALPALDRLLTNRGNVSQLHRHQQHGQQHQHQQQQLQQVRYMSDNLLGHSPMARPDPRPKSYKGGGDGDSGSGSTGPVIGVDSNTKGGGVWAQTSAKRDKMGELKLEIPPDKRTLDDMATPAQKVDLDLADGLGLVARAVDGAWSLQSDADGDSMSSSSGDSSSDRSSSRADITAALADLNQFLIQTEQSRGEDAQLSKERYEAHLAEVMRILEPDVAAASPSERLTPRDALALLRDFVAFEPETGDEKEAADGDGDTDKDSSSASSKNNVDGPASAPPSVPADVDSDLRVAEDPFDTCTAYLRLLTARHAASLLKDSWEDSTKLTDGDVDRAAVRGESADQPTHLPLVKVNNVLRAYATGTCRDRVDALWTLWDKDDDGLIDEVEMDFLANWSMKPVEGALAQLFADALEELASAEDVVAAQGEATATRSDGSNSSSSSEPAVANAEKKKKKGWRQRRREAKAKKRLINIFDKTIANHFEIEVETPHRLRCIYAWAEKAHQNDRIDSVHIESGTIAGRKRYVELAPKISLDEFRAVQEEHFPHFDRIGEEIAASFREDLLVAQGKGRQNRELKRDIVVFLGVVSAIDAVIWSL